jgi:DNA-directed RNA polymerase subunit M/transcription elongation factor TFIIS
MNLDPETERQRLVDQYAGMADGELEFLAQDSPDLTEEARQALQAEMSRRQLGVEGDRSVPVAEDTATWEDLVIVKEFRDLPEALLAKGSLESAGIECFLGDDNMVRMDWFLSNLVGGIKLSVRPEDADTAVELLEQSLPESFEVDGVGTYEQPTCPQCHSREVSYETLNKPAAYTSAWIGVPIPVPRQRWKCDACGHDWKEPDAQGE